MTLMAWHPIQDVGAVLAEQESFGMDDNWSEEMQVCDGRKA